MARRFFLTRRALEDLGVSEDLAGEDARELVDEHHLIKKFVKMRAQKPTGQESLLRANVFWNLHGTNPWRGVTWYDDKQDIVWLCAANGHDYNEFLVRHANGELAPNAADYADIEARIEDLDRERLKELRAEPFMDVAPPECTMIRVEAEAHPGNEVSRVVANEIQVSVVVDALDPDDLAVADVYVGIQYPRADVRPVPDDLDLQIVVMVCPEMQYEDLDWYVDDFPRLGGRNDGEVVMRWRRS